MRLYICIYMSLYISVVYGQDVQSLNMGMDKYRVYNVDGGKIIGSKELDYNVGVNYSQDALVDSYSKSSIVKYMSQVGINGTYGLIEDRLSIGIGVGYNYISGDDGVRYIKSGVDNIKFAPKFRVVSHIVRGGVLKLDFSLMVVSSIPMGSGVGVNTYKGIISGDIKDKVGYNINIGYRVGDGIKTVKGEEIGLKRYLGDGVIWGVGIYSVGNWKGFQGMGSISGRGVDVVEGVVGVRYNEMILLGFGQGITSGIGSVSGRFIVSVEGVVNSDRDKDGVKDSVDRCVDESEDRDGYKDDDGCPDMDNDGDGVVDIYDMCVGEVENMNGYKDSDGCIDEVSGVVDVSEIYFEKGGDGIIMGRSYPVLKRLVDIMGSRGRLEVVLLGGDVVLLNSRGVRIVRELESILGVGGRVIYRVVVSGEDGVEFRVIYGVVGK
jgi:hypothetical protein